MAKLLTFGIYNNLYKYIWLYVIFRLLYAYIFNYKTIPTNLKPFILDSFPNNFIFTGSFFEYITTFFISFIFRRYELYQLKNEDNISISDTNSYKSTGTGAFNLIQLNIEKGKISKSFCFIIIVIVLANLLTGSYYNLYLEGTDFWELELLLISLVNTMIFGEPLYRHQIFAILITIISCSITKTLSLIEIFRSDEDKLFKIYIWIIPLAIISFIIAEFLRAYGYCKAKYYFNLKFLSVNVFLKYYGLIGSLICLLGSLISTYNECTSYYDNKNIKYICRNYKDNHNYFDSFKLYFDKFWNKETTSKNVGYVFLFILKNTFLAMTSFFTFSIIKHLGPEFYVCANSIYYLIVEILNVIGYLISHDNEVNKYKIISEIFLVISAAIYLEFIELNFFKINYDSKRNIEFRLLSEMSELNINDESEELEEKEIKRVDSNFY